MGRGNRFVGRREVVDGAGYVEGGGEGREGAGRGPGTAAAGRGGEYWGR